MFDWCLIWYCAFQKRKSKHFSFTNSILFQKDFIEQIQTIHIIRVWKKIQLKKQNKFWGCKLLWFHIFWGRVKNNAEFIEYLLIIWRIKKWLLWLGKTRLVESGFYLYQHLKFFLVVYPSEKKGIGEYSCDMSWKDCCEWKNCYCICRTTFVRYLFCILVLLVWVSMKLKQ